MTLTSRFPWSLVVLSGVFLGAVALVVANGAAPMVDEWVYIDAAQRFAHESVVHVSPMSFAPAAFEAVLGGIAIKLFGDSLTVLIFATALLSLAAGVALWDLLIRSGASPLMAAIGTAALLFSAVFFGLSATYMTDAHAVALATIAAALFSRGIDGSQAHAPWLFAGSIVVTAGYFSRPGVLFVVAGVLVVSIRKREILPVMAATAVPVMAVVTQLLAALTGILMYESPDVLSRIVMPSARTLGQGLVTTTVTTGVFIVPLAPALCGAIAKAGFKTKLSALLGTLAVLLIMVLLGTPPLLGNWLGVTGVFPIDESTIGARTSLIGVAAFWIVVLLSLWLAVSAATLILTSRSVSALRSAEIGLWAFAGGSLTLGIFTAVAVWGRILDRYLVVLLPALLLTLITRSLRSVDGYSVVGRLSLVAMAFIGLLSVVMTFDGMRLQTSIFEMAESAVSDDVPATSIDGGAAWVGFTFGLDMEPEEAEHSRREDWWRVSFAPDINPRYFVSLNPETALCSVSSAEVEMLLGKPSRIALKDSQCLTP